jgi:type 1 fimbria pilin
VLSLGEGTGAASQGSGVVDHCTFTTDGLYPWAVAVGDSKTPTIDGTVTIENCDFSGVNPGGTPIYVTPGDVNATKVRAVNNTM